MNLKIRREDYVNYELKNLDEKKKKAYKNIYFATRKYIFGLENKCSASPKNKEYKNVLLDHEGLVKNIYKMVTTNIYGENYSRSGKEASSYMWDIQFCDRNWIVEQIKNEVNRVGY